jgi:hypothetical protein
MRVTGWDLVALTLIGLLVLVEVGLLIATVMLQGGHS